MLSISGPPVRHCDDLSRRHFLTVGALGLGGLTLADLLKAEDAADNAHSQRAIINIHLDGGPPQMDTIDPKPDAPVELRGEFSSITTKLPGVHFTELMPKCASIADKLVMVRSLVGSIGKHHAFQCQSGFDENDLAAMGGRPAMGCAVSHLLGKPEDAAPAFVDLMQGRPLVRNSARPGFLGPAYKPFRPDMSKWFQRELEEGMKGELASRGENHATSLKLHAELPASRLDDRQTLLASVDRLRRQVDGRGMMDALDRFNQQAAGILTSGRLADALDLSLEDARTLEKYTAPVSRLGQQSTTSEGPDAPRKLLMARRLIEAGARVVSVSISDFDTHSNNFERMRNLVPIVDHGIHALITDLEERGLLDQVTIVAWGEFGRTPTVNKNGGRDHWPKVGPALLAGGGLKSGQVIGSTDRIGGEVKSRPVTYKEIFATLYHQIGINPHRVTIDDPRGRPQYLLDEGEPLQDLI